MTRRAQAERAMRVREAALAGTRWKPGGSRRQSAGPRGESCLTDLLYGPSDSSPRGRDELDNSASLRSGPGGARLMRYRASQAPIECARPTQKAVEEATMTNTSAPPRR